MALPLRHNKLELCTLAVSRQSPGTCFWLLIPTDSFYYLGLCCSPSTRHTHTCCNSVSLEYRMFTLWHYFNIKPIISYHLRTQVIRCITCFSFSFLKHAWRFLLHSRVWLYSQIDVRGPLWLFLSLLKFMWKCEQLCFLLFRLKIIWIRSFGRKFC